MQSQQWLPASDLETSPPAPPLSPPGLIRRRRRVRRLHPYEPEPFVRLFRRHEEGLVHKNTARERVCEPPSPVIPLSPAPSPTIFYHQTTIAPLPSSNPSTSPAAHSDPLSSRKRAHLLVPSSSDPYVQAAAEATAHSRPRKRVNARKWSFLLPIIHYWRFQEGAPRATELGESSSTAALRILLVTEEPFHHTILLLAARLVRHEDCLDPIVDILDDLPLEKIENLGDEV